MSTQMFFSYKNVHSLKKKAETVLAQGNINAALRLVHNMVGQIITEPMCTSQVFASLELDQLCLSIGRHNLTVLQEKLSSDDEHQTTVLYVVSRLQRSGGHSRLVQDFIRAQPEKHHLILSTEVGGPSDIKFFSRLFSTEENVHFMRAPRENFSARLRWLQSTLLSSRPEHVYLFNHHQDSVAVAALVPELKLPGSFCHHGDHHLCLGVHLNHLTHIDFHPMGFHYCRDELKLDNQYLPLTFEDKQCVAVETDFMQGGKLITATAARSNKIEVPYYICYMEIIPRVLQVTGGSHIHIGRLTPWALLRIYHHMRKHGVPKDRFVYIEWSPSVWKTLQDHKVDVYIASFPYGAGLTLIEAMGAGVPVIMHEHWHSRVLSGLELAYPEAYRWSDPEDLLVYLKSMRPEKLKSEKVLSRRQYECFHQPKMLADYFCSSETREINIPNLSTDFSPRLDEWARFITLRLNFRYLASKYLMRTARKIRSVFH